MRNTKIRLIDTGFCETFQINPEQKLGSWIEGLIKHNASVRLFLRSKHGYAVTLQFEDQASLDAFRADKAEQVIAAKTYAAATAIGTQP